MKRMLILIILANQNESIVAINLKEEITSDVHVNVHRFCPRGKMGIFCYLHKKVEYPKRLQHVVYRISKFNLHFQSSDWILHKPNYDEIEKRTHGIKKIRT